MKGNDFWAHVGISTFAFCLHVPLVLRHLHLRGVDLNVWLFVCGLFGIVGVALLSRAIADVSRSSAEEEEPAAPSTTVAIREWIVKRGVLYAMTQAPIFAIVASNLFLGLARYSFTIYAVIFSFAALPVWIAHRKARSTDPDEPVHHLHRYAMCALVPMAAFSVARFPTNLLFGMAYWHPWYDFGNALTGEPINQLTSLVPGAVLYSLQGYSLTMGFYILFRKHSLANGLLYLCVYLSAVYAFVFPVYGRVGMPSPPVWHATIWWAHGWMGVAAWGTPKIWAAVLGRTRGVARAASVVAIASFVVAPAVFAVWRANVWQFPKQHQIDVALFDRATMNETSGSATLVSVAGDEAHYRFALRFGPRAYKNYVNRRIALEGRDLDVSGRLVANGTTIAFCSAHVAHLESPRAFVEHPYEYDQKLKAMDYADVPVECVGPAKDALRTDGPVAVRWSASMTLVGDRESRMRLFQGTAEDRLAGGEALLARADVTSNASRTISATVPQ